MGINDLTQYGAENIQAYYFLYNKNCNVKKINIFILFLIYIIYIL